MTTTTTPQAAATLPAAATGAPQPPAGAPARARTAHGGDGAGPRLTIGQRLVLQLAADGCTQDEIARRLGIHVRAVGFRLARAEAALGARTRIQAVYLAIKAGEIR